MKKETAHWGAGINTVSQASEIHATLTQLFYQRNKMPHTAPQTPAAATLRIAAMR